MIQPAQTPADPSRHAHRAQAEAAVPVAAGTVLQPQETSASSSPRVSSASSGYVTDYVVLAALFAIIAFLWMQ